MGLLSRVLLAVLMSSAQLAVSGGEFPSKTEQNNAVRHVAQGQLLIDSVYVAPPYSIDVSQDVVVVNGQRFDASFHADMFDRGDGERGFREDGNFGPDGAGSRRYGRMRFDVEGNNRRQPWRPSAAQVADLLAHTLRDDAIVVAFSGRDATILELNSSKATFCEAFLTPEPSQELESGFNELCQDPDRRGEWGSLLRRVRPTPELARWMQRQVEEYSSIENANIRQIAAAHRLQHAAYPLTLVGMLLGVFSLGHTLKWSAKSDCAVEAVRFLKIGLVLIIAMSALDLTWTIMSSQAGHMREVNPIAANVIDSPFKLILFKLVATLGACGILYWLRSNPKVQAATWWMCLVCVLLTFRWVVFNSLMV